MKKMVIIFALFLSLPGCSVIDWWNETLAMGSSDTGRGPFMENLNESVSLTNGPSGVIVTYQVNAPNANSDFSWSETKHWISRALDHPLLDYTVISGELPREGCFTDTQVFTNRLMCYRVLSHIDELLYHSRAVTILITN